jgi:hypothetical protein
MHNQLDCVRRSVEVACLINVNNNVALYVILEQKSYIFDKSVTPNLALIAHHYAFHIYVRVRASIYIYIHTHTYTYL